MTLHSDFLKTIRQSEAHLLADAEQALYEGHLGVRGTGLYAALGIALDALSGIASCRRGCTSRDHVSERLVRRFVNSCLASLRLVLTGYNDEAVAVLRVSAEIANLLQLFDRDASHQEAWYQLDDRNRRKRYSPVHVRKLLQASCAPFFGEQAYGVLSGSGTHLSPEGLNASHDLEASKLWVGPMVSLPAIVMIWCELGYGCGAVLSLGTLTASLDHRTMDAITDAREALQAAIGAGELRLVNYRPILSWFRAQTTAAEGAHG